MSKLKVNELDTRSGTDITVTTGKTVVIPAGATISVAGTQTATGTVNLVSSTLSLPATLPATIGTNITQLPGANITGTIPAAALGNVDFGPTEDDIAVLGFQVAAASDLAKYSLRDQIVDTFQDTSGVDAGASTDEVRDATGKYYSGQVVGGLPTGGTETTVGGYVYHSFTSTGANNFVVAAVGTVEVFMIAGGGGGGAHHGGGGGAGAAAHDTALAVTAQTYALSVGVQGAASPAGDYGGTGGDSTGFGWTVKGGGGGADYPNRAGATGGCGGGGGGDASGAGGPTNQGSYTQSAGTRTVYQSTGGSRSGGETEGWGGGIAAATGKASLSVSNFSQFGASGVFGGGGGCGNNPGTGTGGGGGAGDGGGNSQNGDAATPQNTGSGGGGGGGGGDSFLGATGASGWIGVRYATNAFLGAVNNMTLVSTANTAEAGTTGTGDLVILYTPETGSTVLNTNLKAYVSRDNGTTYTPATLTGKGSYSGTTEIATAHDLDISSQPAGTSMRWKIETLVQSASLVTRVNGVSLGWS